MRQSPQAISMYASQLHPLFSNQWQKKALFQWRVSQCTAFVMEFGELCFQDLLLWKSSACRRGKQAQILHGFGFLFSSFGIIHLVTSQSASANPGNPRWEVVDEKMKTKQVDRKKKWLLNSYSKQFWCWDNNEWNKCKSRIVMLVSKMDVSVCLNICLLARKGIYLGKIRITSSCC